MASSLTQSLHQSLNDLPDHVLCQIMQSVGDGCAGVSDARQLRDIYHNGQASKRFQALAAAAVKAQVATCGRERCGEPYSLDGVGPRWKELGRHPDMKGIMQRLSVCPACLPQQLMSELQQLKYQPDTETSRMVEEFWPGRTRTSA